MVVSLAGAAAAAEPELALDCGQLTREHAAEVEARARATLLPSPVAVVRIVISCSEAEARVVVESPSSQAIEQVPLLTPDIRTTLVDAVDRALQTLSSRPSNSGAPPLEPEPEPESVAKAPVPEPVSPPALVAAAPAPIPVAPTPTSTAGAKRSLHASASALAELWRYGGGLGGALGVAYGTRQLQLGLRLGGLTSPDSSGDFRASELSAALGVAWAPGWAYGLRGAAGLGPSLLLVSPQSDLTPRGDTSVAAWFFELELARPFWFGAWAFTPALGVRLFTAERQVTLDSAELLIIPYVAPRLALSLAYAFD